MRPGLRGSLECLADGTAVASVAGKVGYPPARRVRGAARRWEEAKERWNGHASKHAGSIIRWCEASLCDARSTPGTVLFVRGPQCGWEPYKPRVDTASPISRNNFVAWTGPVVFGPQPPASFGLESGWTPNRTEPGWHGGWCGDRTELKNIKGDWTRPSVAPPKHNVFSNIEIGKQKVGAHLCSTRRFPKRAQAI